MIILLFIIFYIILCLAGRFIVLRQSPIRKGQSTRQYGDDTNAGQNEETDIGERLQAIKKAEQSGACISACEAVRNMPQEELLRFSPYDIEKSLMRAIDVRELIARYKPDHVERYVPKHKIDAVYGAIYGDIAGSRYEFSEITPDEYALPDANNAKNYRVTDDSVLTIATIDALYRAAKAENNVDADHIFSYTTLSGDLKNAFAERYQYHGMHHLYAGYGSSFYRWLTEKSEHSDYGEPYGSRGNGSAMRIASVGALGLSYDETVTLAIASAACTHDHIEGIRGAVVTAVAVWLACAGASKEDIFQYVKRIYTQPGMNLFEQFTMREAQAVYVHPVECQFSVPAAMIAVHESVSYEDGILKAMRIGRDTDTNACIAGGVLGALYGIKTDVIDAVNSRLDVEQRGILGRYASRYATP